MNRRAFLLRIGGTTLAVPAVLVLTACGGGGDGGSPDAPASFTVQSGGQMHSHQITVVCSDLSGSGVTYTSTVADAHSHTVTLSAGDLATVAGGGTATITTTDLHTHTWAVSKPSFAC